MRWAVLACLMACAVPAYAQRPLPDAIGNMWLAMFPAPGERANINDSGGAAAQALAHFGREDRIDDPQTVCGEVVANDPLAAIATRAKDAQIVIINEAHYRPRDRAFVTEVTRALRPLGFDTFAAQTFTETIVRTGNAAPLMSDGTYVSEPAFGDEIRALRALNYRLVPYEQTAAQYKAAGGGVRIGARERAEADNLIANIFAERPNARVIVHVGFSHLAEEPRSGNVWMAARLKEKLGVDPLTIDQTSFASPTRSAVICGGGENRFAADILVAQPPLTFVDHRPAWRAAAGQKFAAIPEALRRPRQRAIYESRDTSEPADAVPKDRLLVEPGEALKLLLPPGAYHITMWTEAEGVSAPVPLTVR